MAILKKYHHYRKNKFIIIPICDIIIKDSEAHKYKRMTEKEIKEMRKK